ncbi:TraR/DksA C4-type zinc finger protein [Photobacterium damselae subsp. damselae]|uniref:TraR/DksA C4-type zinc finger protein n=1 Tax=Photobacterium damselae subsp. damselae TaxID=85581 RepID=A0A850QX12_PHODD|nr:TraR/DksA C4-type zinc finger protein [Photobacterium damselae subsp. damselae]
MTDLFDRAQQLEEMYRDNAIHNHQHRQSREIPDEDEQGRYCLTCGELIQPARLEANPNAVRCVPWQELKERH